MFYKTLSERLIKYNDHELLYLISEGNDDAKEIMFNKYLFLIKTKINSFNVQRSEIDDYLQEGLITLNKAIKLYKVDSKMSFTNYFDLLLKRRFIDLYRKDKTYNFKNSLTEEVDCLMETDAEFYIPDLDYECLSEFEKIVFNLKFNNALLPEDIAKKLDITLKQVYNATERIKQKLRKQINLNK